MTFWAEIGDWLRLLALMTLSRTRSRLTMMWSHSRSVMEKLGKTEAAKNEAVHYSKADSVWLVLLSLLPMAFSRARQQLGLLLQYVVL
ncbi:hypothetical protein M430DRAFT_32943 [Amorphotheca resinae ATCC 22711]|uniref:Uncharacterized protein n=1 Tax=Amorphotheca resinae ATCC 22711 TaxID=857342 RepID=A0A2T3BA04_AMORE|nr:hypothetical protein M430DRAFT_32943 [Amorphotheca resinae ATCC 22711]PSS25118.1 hypothetical protein M430DRAFT_32943 [Amorphotheca resinae ATCC 22711]